MKKAPPVSNAHNRPVVDLIPMVFPAIAIYGAIFLVFLGFATAGLRYQFGVSKVVPMTVVSELLMCRYDNDPPSHQNKNSIRFFAQCDDEQQAKRFKQNGFIHVKPTSLKLKMRAVAPPIFETQLELFRDFHIRYHLSQVLSIRVSKLRNEERAELASKPPSYEGFWIAFQIALVLYVTSWLGVWIRLRRSRRNSQQAP
jgi:hypothetical protein